MATASATTTACSGRRSSTAGRSSCRRTGSSHGNPWEFERREVAYEIGFGGTVEPTTEARWQRERTIWQPAENVLAVAFDTPIVGWRGERVNTLRLWSARALDPIRLDAFNRGDHVGALAERNRGPRASRACSIRPTRRRPARNCGCGRNISSPRPRCRICCAGICSSSRTSRNLADKVAIQLNDTHPAIAVAELMRLLVDIHGIAWDEAWEITRATISYTNHTLLPEALETWPVPLFERLLPRHMQIIYAINAS